MLAGDYNVIPAPGDVYDPVGWAGDALFLPQTRAKFQELLNLGYTEALRAVDRRDRALHILGLSGRRLAEEQWAAHRSSAALAAGRRPAAERDDRQGAARRREALRPCADQMRSGMTRERWSRQP